METSVLTIKQPQGRTGTNKMNLTPARHQTQKDFYNKARIEAEADTISLISYATKVATYNTATKSLAIKGFYSNTTTRHLKAFIDYLNQYHKAELLEANSTTQELAKAYLNK